MEDDEVYRALVNTRDELACELNRWYEGRYYDGSRVEQISTGAIALSLCVLAIEVLQGFEDED